MQSIQDRPAPVIAMAALLLLCGCVHLPSRSNSAGRQPMPANLKEKLARSPHETVEVAVTEEKVRHFYRTHRVELTVDTPSNGTNFTSVCEYYQNRSSNAPVILLLPMSGGHYPIERYFARYFARRGFSVVIPHRRRYPREQGLEAINPWVIASVQDFQRILDWLETRPEVDATRFALFGISRGGLQGALLAAADHRVKAATLGLVGGDLPYVLAHTREPNIREQRVRLLRESGLSLDELQDQLREQLDWDPRDLGEYIDASKTLLVLGVFDRIVPFEKGWELRSQLGGTEALLLPTGHITAALCIPCIQSHSLRFFRRHLDVEAPPLKRLRSPRDASGTWGN